MPTIPVADPDEGTPFPKLRTVRSAGHPHDDEARDWHIDASPFRWWPHSHLLIEDMTFEAKQRLGAHIDRWHFPPEAFA